jgi:hypothetical protein
MRPPADIKIPVIAGFIHGAVFGAQVVRVRVGVLAGLGKAVGFGPDVFPVPGIHVPLPPIPTGFGHGAARIDGDDVGGVHRVFVGLHEDGPDTIIGEAGMVFDNLMQGGFERRAGLAGGGRIVDIQ